jgi:hypothetical protein
MLSSISRSPPNTLNGFHAASSQQIKKSSCKSKSLVQRPVLVYDMNLFPDHNSPTPFLLPTHATAASSFINAVIHLSITSSRRMTHLSNRRNESRLQHLALPLGTGAAPSYSLRETRLCLMAQRKRVSSLPSLSFHLLFSSIRSQLLTECPGNMT